MSHTRVGWYEECTQHPQPGPDTPDDVAADWDDTHFTIGGHQPGDLSFRTCEANRLFDICAEDTLQLQQEAEESDEVCVPWPCPAATTDGAE